jgi:hypothetical protein
MTDKKSKKSLLCAISLIGCLFLCATVSATAQISSKYTFGDETYSIVALSSPIGFNPVNYGILPMWLHSACWAGYWCEYDISEDGIILTNLFINSVDGHYPEINGVSVRKEPIEDGHHVYEGINLPLEYTGRIVAGTDFLPEYYIHMGYQRAWAYEKLVEFVFEKGKLVETIDHSLVAAQMREEIKDPDGFWEQLHDNIPRYVDDSFSLDFAVKAWWLE